MASPRKPVLIIGAGIAGLAFAQGLRKKGIPFLVFERDASTHSRPQGWALTIHFSLPCLLDLLPEDIGSRIHTTQIDPTIKHDQNPSVFLNLDDCSAKWRLPPTYGNRMRVARGRLRDLLTEGLEDQILWAKNLQSFDLAPDRVQARFDDGSCYDGELLVGVDGCHSRVRSLIYGPELSRLTPIPACFLGTQALATEKQMRPLLGLERTLFQGCHPSTPTWMWFSVMERPEVNGSIQKEPLWRVQICLSWLSPAGQSEIPKTDKERVQLMREKSSGFHPIFRDVFRSIIPSDHKPIINVPLEFWWLPQDAKPHQYDGRVLLAGDAAHTMPLYRGEGFNHALMDVYRLLQSIERLHTEASSREVLVADYEEEVRSRGRQAARMCREACLEVHQWDTLGDHSVVRQKSVF
ncbi:FAD/NAD(P)-binding domain-containing protein [Cenococcum geophilum]